LLAVLTKGVAATAPHGVAALLSSGETYSLLVVGLAGVYLQQLAFQAGALQASLPVIAVLEPVAAAGLGMALLHEQLQATGARLAVLIAAAVGMTMATIALARDQADVVPVDTAAGVEMAHG
jgi:drug/metabolite transporter (DMT)-like permease